MGNVNVWPNSGFELSWTDHPTASIQIPKHLDVKFTEGEQTAIDHHNEPWYTVAPEAVHSPVDWLPEHEQRQFGAQGDYIYKLFGHQKPIHVRIVAEVHGLVVDEQCDFTASIFVDVYERDQGKVPPGPNEESHKRAARIRMGVHVPGDSLWMRSYWFDEKSIGYDQWYLNRHDITYSFYPIADTMEMAIEFWCPWALFNNGFFIENIRAMVPDTDQPQPTPSYESTMLVMPKQYTLKQGRRLMGREWTKGRTMGKSIHDGCVLGHPVLVDFTPQQKQDHLDWIGDNYPDVLDDVEFMSTYNGWQQYALGQRQPAWRDTKFGPGECTFGVEGCFMCGLASAQRILGIDDDATPLSIDAKLHPDGYAHPCNPKHTIITERLGMDIQPRYSDVERYTDEALSDGCVVLTEVEPQERQHFVVIVEKRAGEYIAIDPYFGDVITFSERYPGIESIRVLRKKKPVVDEPQYESVLNPSVHAQVEIEGLPRFVNYVGGIKLVDIVGAVGHFDPDVFVLFRKWLPHQAQYYGVEGSRALCHEHLFPILDHYGDKVNAIETSMNEEIGPGGQDQRDKNLYIMETEMETIRLIHKRYDGKTKVVACNAGPGAFPLDWISDFDPLFKLLSDTGGYFGDHTYIPAKRMPDGSIMYWISEWYSMRTKFILDYARERNWFFQILGTEHGLIGGEMGDDGNLHMNPGAGWRSDLCIGGDWEAHNDIIFEAESEFNRLNTRYGNAYSHRFLFTIAFDWDNFQYWTEELDSLMHNL